MDDELKARTAESRSSTSMDIRTKDLSIYGERLTRIWRKTLALCDR